MPRGSGPRWRERGVAAGTPGWRPKRVASAGVDVVDLVAGI
jgi:hypothetical protein